MFLKVIACEIATRELQFCAARSKNLVDLEFLPQGHHDTPAIGREEVQGRINSVPEKKYDAIVLGYGLCSRILVGLRTRHTCLVIPRAHDCISFFLGSRERYERRFFERPGTYYCTSGWLECATRRGAKGSIWTGVSLPANSGLNLKETYEEWARKFGEDQARYLLEESTRWMRSYTHGCLIDFDFLQHLDLDRAAQQICSEKGWTFEKIAGDLSLFQRMVDGPWPDSEFLIVHPGETITATGDDNIVGLEQESLTTDGLG